MKYYVTLILIFGILVVSEAQVGYGGQPLSSGVEVSSAFQEIYIPPPDINKLAIEDDTIAKDGSYRFGILIPVDLSPENSGTWESAGDGHKIWRLRLFTDGSEAVSLYFDDFMIPPGGRLFVYDDEGNQLLGAFTWKNKRERGNFATALIRGSSVVLEYDMPVDGKVPAFKITDFGYAYRGVYSTSGSKGFGSSDPCEVNIACSPEGDQWQDEKHSVCRIQVKISKGLYWCSGSLLNNTNYDKIPYVLTADHCAFKYGHYASQENLDEWIFYFNYFSESCENPQQEPGYDSFTGCDKVAQGGNRATTGSDFYLIRLQETPPDNYKLYFNGWNTEDVSVAHGVTLHHPEGDIQKISTFDTPLVSTSYNGNGVQSHWKVTWAETENNWGVTEGGSSGSPLFDSLGRVIGTLTGGLASCNNQSAPDYYGKFAFHWNSNGNADTAQLEPWLDPQNTGINSLGGLYLSYDVNFERPDKKVVISPNPVDERICLTLEDFEKSKFSVEIYNVLGEVRDYFVFHNVNDRVTVNVSGLKKGIYFVKVTQNEFVVVKKIIKN